jgi:hypothetical protein
MTVADAAPAGMTTRFVRPPARPRYVPEPEEPTKYVGSDDEIPF